MVLSDILTLIRNPKIMVAILVVLVLGVVAIVFVFPVQPSQVPVPPSQFNPVAFCEQKSIEFGVPLVFDPELNACVEVSADSVSEVPEGVGDREGFCSNQGKDFVEVLGENGSCVPSADDAQALGQDLERACRIKGERLEPPLPLIWNGTACDVPESFKISICESRGLVFDVSLDDCVESGVPVPLPTVLTDSLCSSTPSAFFFALNSVAVEGGCNCPAGTLLIISGAGIPVCSGAGTQLPSPVPIVGGEGLIPSIILTASNALSTILATPSILFQSGSEIINNIVFRPISETVSNIQVIVNNATENISTFINASIIEPITNIPVIISDTFSNISTTISNTVSNVTNTVTDFGSTIITGVTNTFTDLQNTVSTTVSNVVNSGTTFMCQTFGVCF